jgi:hypothetical protein
MLRLKTVDNLLSAYYYVAYRSRHPDEATKNEALRELQANNIDATQLVDWPANHCQEPVPSDEGGSTA